MKLSTMLLPTGEFILIGSEAAENSLPPEEFLLDLRKQVGAAAILFTTHPVEGVDALYDQNAIRRFFDDEPRPDVDPEPAAWRQIGLMMPQETFEFSDAQLDAVEKELAAKAVELNQPRTITFAGDVSLDLTRMIYGDPADTTAVHAGSVYVAPLDEAGQPCDTTTRTILDNGGEVSPSGLVVGGPRGPENDVADQLTGPAPLAVGDLVRVLETSTVYGTLHVEGEYDLMVGRVVNPLPDKDGDICVNIREKYVYVHRWERYDGVQLGDTVEVLDESSAVHGMVGTVTSLPNEASLLEVFISGVGHKEVKNWELTCQPAPAAAPVHHNPDIVVGDEIIIVALSDEIGYSNREKRELIGLRGQVEDLEDDDEDIYVVPYDRPNEGYYVSKWELAPEEPASWYPDRAEKLSEAVGQAIGAGSTCWERLSGSGEFQSDKAVAIVNGLQKWIDDNYVISKKGNYTSELGGQVFSQAQWTAVQTARENTQPGFPDYTQDSRLVDLVARVTLKLTRIYADPAWIKYLPSDMGTTAELAGWPDYVRQTMTEISRTLEANEEEAHNG